MSDTSIERRKEQSFQVRKLAADEARARDHPIHVANGEEDLYTNPKTNKPSLIASFTKGLPHDRETGLIANPDNYDPFVRAINTGSEGVIRGLPLGPGADVGFTSGIAQSVGNVKVRAWESMTAGLAFDLEGPDAQSVTMPPAPTLNSAELITEMTELYWMALLRDVKFTEFKNCHLVAAAASSLNNTSWVSNREGSTPNITQAQINRLRDRTITPENIFRGQGDNAGPYISQFLLRGNTGRGNSHTPDEGYIQYGSQRIDQRVRVATPKKDYMTSWQAWLDVQNAASISSANTFDDSSNGYRFITTPRDLATYVHYDALYQAYLNACIIMLEMGRDKIDFDEGLPFTEPDSEDKQQGFATFGAPHILSLVTEVATRALKAARFQKFNTHRRLRPEAIGGLMERINNKDNEDDAELFAPAVPLYESLDKDLLRRIGEHNKKQNQMSDGGFPRSDDYSPTGRTEDTLLLPMAFAEGSPMHPSYGAGHATVAGACVTVLKAFFNTKRTLDTVYVPSTDGKTLEEVPGMENKLTVEDELNKLAANISIGRNWGGVHYYTDYYESVLLGEKIALGILEEQRFTYPESFSMTVPLFFNRGTKTISN